ncbi:MAG TPA: rhodanese-like domain-containing protein [Melioribacteraceae bacterium]|nr:rhodanese-like domain-containing protein [Melioribacteraceae bacterium]
MKFLEFLFKLDLKIKLAAVAVFLGFTAFVISDPFENSTAKINMKDLSYMVQNEVDHVNVDDLADWIIKGKSDYRLVDIRSEKEFGNYNIPGSENIPITGLLDGNLSRNEKIVLYSEGGIHSAQAWFLLKAKEFKNVYILRGGLDEWNDLVLFPKLSANATEQEKARFEILSAISRYFGGAPQLVSGESSTAITLQPAVPSAPKIQAPASSSPGGAKKKKREGC